MNFRRSYVIALLLFVGCATSETHRAGDLRMQWKRNTIYEVFRLAKDNGTGDAGLRQACERVLSQLAQDTNEVVRLDAASWLAGLGNETAVKTAVSILEHDRSPKVRAEVGRALCRLLPRPQRAQEIILLGSVQITNPPVVPFWGLSPEVDRRPIEEAVAKAFLHDDAVFELTYVDSVPLLPFLERTHRTTWSVRGAIADALEYHGKWSEVVKRTVRQAAVAQDPVLAQEASQLLEAWDVESGKGE